MCATESVAILSTNGVLFDFGYVGYGRASGEVAILSTNGVLFDRQSHPYF